MLGEGKALKVSRCVLVCVGGDQKCVLVCRSWWAGGEEGASVVQDDGGGVRRSQTVVWLAR